MKRLTAFLFALYFFANSTMPVFAGRNGHSTGGTSAGNLSPSSDTLISRAKVDLVEVNHFVDETGREVFQQTIFYDWSKSQNRYLVRHWRLVKAASQLPKPASTAKGFVCQWTENGTIRQVFAARKRQTWTQTDPERTNRAHLPEDARKPLFRR
ncbi:MAG: hypothetical protein AAF664_11810 [Planctomycetota bacterium]